MKKLVDDGFEMCVDLTAVDFLTHASRTLARQCCPRAFRSCREFTVTQQARALARACTGE